MLVRDANDSIMIVYYFFPTYLGDLKFQPQVLILTNTQRNQTDWRSSLTDCSSSFSKFHIAAPSRDGERLVRLNDYRMFTFIQEFQGEIMSGY